MKKLILAFVSVVALASCNKEANLENRLEGKWKIDSETITGSTSVTTGNNTIVSDINSANTTRVTTGDIDFISDNKLVMHKVTTISFTEGGTTTSEVDEDNEVLEYYVSDKDEITLIEDDEYTVFSVSTNKKDSQVWEYESNETETENYTGETTTIKYSMKVSMSLSLIK